MPQTFKITVADTVFEEWRRGRRRVITLPKDRKTRRIRSGHMLEINGLMGLPVIRLTPYPSIRAAVRNIGDVFLPDRDENAAYKIWQRDVARTKPNCEVIVFHVNPS